MTATTAIRLLKNGIGYEIWSGETCLKTCMNLKNALFWLRHYKRGGK